MTFLSAPPSSTPMTSSPVYTRKRGGREQPLRVERGAPGPPPRRPPPWAGPAPPRRAKLGPESATNRRLRQALGEHLATSAPACRSRCPWWRSPPARPAPPTSRTAPHHARGPRGWAAPTRRRRRPAPPRPGRRTPAATAHSGTPGEEQRVLVRPVDRLDHLGLVGPQPHRLALARRAGWPAWCPSCRRRGPRRRSWRGRCASRAAEAVLGALEQALDVARGGTR